MASSCAPQATRVWSKKPSEFSLTPHARRRTTISPLTFDELTLSVLCDTYAFKVNSFCKLFGITISIIKFLSMT